ncbi:phosphomannose isomerase type II C-terminal cupin domain [Candidatus Nomurabacteria bacterium]|nr:phosphomannose isomerase type II C-terminal cupin domain [Candidatus Nomurabacteria bacterium]
MEEFKPFTVVRPWGEFRQLTHNSTSTVKIHRIKPNQENSFQSHKKRSEFWYIISGGGKIVINDQELDANPGDEFTAELGDKHRWIAGPLGMVLAEVAIGDFDEEDIIRYEDDYGRA